MILILQDFFIIVLKVRCFKNVINILVGNSAQNSL